MNPHLENISRFVIGSNQTKEKHILESKFSSVSDHKAGFLKSKIIPSREPKYGRKLPKKKYHYFTCDVFKLLSLLFIPESYFVLNHEKQKYI